MRVIVAGYGAAPSIDAIDFTWSSLARTLEGGLRRHIAVANVVSRKLMSTGASTAIWIVPHRLDRSLASQLFLELAGKSA